MTQAKNSILKAHNRKVFINRHWNAIYTTIVVMFAAIATLLAVAVWADINLIK